ncbi:MAG: Na(+)/H(+) antiporter subunit B [Halofilum sp. (in: g-proteobacteria)]
MKSNPIVREVTNFMMPPILLFALYVQFHGEYSPGGGFQAGVVFAAGIIAFALVHGLERTQRVITPGVIRTLVSVGLLLYIAVGFATMLLGGNFLEYDVLLAHGEGHGGEHEYNTHGQHLGILVIELGVGITVTAVMIAIFYSFAARRAAHRLGREE